LAARNIVWGTVRSEHFRASWLRIVAHLTQHLGELSQELVDLFAKMRSSASKDRPSATDALAEVRRIKRSLAPEVLWREEIPMHLERPMPPAVAEFWKKVDEQTRGKAATQKKRDSREQPGDGVETLAAGEDTT
jgi:hypothetical protein